jgi:hypothetical protein
MATYEQRGSGGAPGRGADPKTDPSTTSKDYDSMLPDWCLIHDIMDGARCIKAKGQQYLPRNQAEFDSSYQRRLKAAPWRPEFVDALRSLCSKPFTKEVVVNPDAPDEIQGDVVDENTKKREGGIVDDIDGMGNSLHVFAREMFVNAVAYGLDAIYVTYPADEPAGPTRADEKEVGARPYWVHIRAEQIIALRTRVVAGRTVTSHIRIKECTVEADGFAEYEVERIRILELDAQDYPTWQTWTKDKDGKYFPDDDPQRLNGVDEIPVVLFFTGERSGVHRVKIPLIDLAHMQIELYRSLSRLDDLLTMTSPMLKIVGVKEPEATPITDEYGRQTGEKPARQSEVGPGVIWWLNSERDGVQPDADYIQPAAANIDALNRNVDGLMEDLRRLALQPTTPKSGNLVATGQAIEGARAHTAVEAWANGLIDALNQALMYTCQWLKIDDTVTAVVHTDFGVDVQGAEEAKVIGAAQARQVLSKQTERQELSRRGILGPDFDEDEEVTRIEGEQAGQDEINTLVPEQKIDPLKGKTVQPNPNTPNKRFVEDGSGLVLQ